MNEQKDQRLSARQSHLFSSPLLSVIPVKLTAMRYNDAFSRPLTKRKHSFQTIPSTGSHSSDTNALLATSG